MNFPNENESQPLKKAKTNYDELEQILMAHDLKHFEEIYEIIESHGYDIDAEYETDERLAEIFENKKFQCMCKGSGATNYEELQISVCNYAEEIKTMHEDTDFEAIADEISKWLLEATTEKLIKHGNEQIEILKRAARERDLYYNLETVEDLSELGWSYDAMWDFYTNLLDKVGADAYPPLIVALDSEREKVHNEYWDFQKHQLKAIGLPIVKIEAWISEKTSKSELNELSIEIVKLQQEANESYLNILRIPDELQSDYKKDKLIEYLEERLKDESISPKLREKTQLLLEQTVKICVNELNAIFKCKGWTQEEIDYHWNQAKFYKKTNTDLGFTWATEQESPCRCARKYCNNPYHDPSPHVGSVFLPNTSKIQERTRSFRTSPKQQPYGQETSKKRKKKRGLGLIKSLSA
ncbi:MAG: hypothetical protein ACRC2V_12555 [Xenococcaceae cyanobacterium]